MESSQRGSRVQKRVYPTQEFFPSENLPPTASLPVSQRSGIQESEVLRDVSGASSANTLSSGDSVQVPRPPFADDGFSTLENELHRFYTRDDTNAKPPPAWGRFVAIDNGCASPRFMRLTLNQIPKNMEVLAGSSVPLAVVLHPLANLPINENPVPLITAGVHGPTTCVRCGAYWNVLTTLVDQGRKFKCNFCGSQNDVPGDRFLELAACAGRLETIGPPELRYGSVEYVDVQDDASRRPYAPVWVFVLDVSYAAVSAGLLNVSLHAVRHVLAGVPCDTHTRVAIITFDKAVHFYTPHVGGHGFRMWAVPDVDDVFVPVPDNLFLSVPDDAATLDALLEQIARVFNSTREGEVGSAAALQAAHLAIRHCGGRIVLFQSRSPTVGPGRPKQTDNRSGPQGSTVPDATQDLFYSQLGRHMASSSVAVHYFIAGETQQYLRSLASLVHGTAGTMHHYPSFSPTRDAEKLTRELLHVLQSAAGGAATLEMRCSAALQVKQFYGHFAPGGAADVQLAGVGTSTCVAVTFKFKHDLGQDRHTFFQAALRYSTPTGSRRVRVHTLSAPVTTRFEELFRCADLDAVVNVNTRIAAAQAVHQPLGKVRDDVLAWCVEVLFSYRKQIAGSAPANSLVLPDTLKLLPLYTLALLKNRAFTTFSDSESGPSWDERAFLLFWLQGASPVCTTNFLYPNLFSLSTPQPPADGSVASVDASKPRRLLLSSDQLQPDGSYLVDDGIEMLLRVGVATGETQLVDAMQRLDLGSAPHDAFTDGAAALMRRLQENAVASFGVWPVLPTARPDALHRRFLSRLVEDAQPDGHSYLQFLAHVHSIVQQKIAHAASEAELIPMLMLQ